MQVEKTVFISYRRANVYTARAVYQHLVAHGYDAFLDYESIDAGSFEQVILNQIAARAHFIIILTPTALERCAEPGDWLRREIEYALELKRNIVPLMFEGFDFGMIVKHLTGKLSVLSIYNGLRVPSDYFEEAMDRLRNRYLSKPLLLILHPTPEADLPAVQQQQTAAAQQPTVTEKQLTAEEWLERGLALNDDSDEEQHCYTRAIELNPAFAAAFYNRGIVRRRRGDLDGAITDYSEALRLNPEYVRAFVNRGHARAARGDRDSALADYTEAIRLDPKEFAAYTNRGAVRIERGDLEGALTDLTEAMRLNPQDAPACYNRSIARYLMQDYAGALADSHEAIRLDSADASAFFNRALIHAALGDTAREIADYEAALCLDPEHAKAKDNLDIARQPEEEPADVPEAPADDDLSSAVG
ncbi:MAG: tetratricopeptide repeat protein [Anaerolineae bacterium]|nr:tetratricopeptide repeat protein [Anaerolineae bacterium]